MKKIFAIFVIIITVAMGGVLAGCNKSNKGWKSIAENTMTQLTRADANYKIEQGDYFAIVDGSKVMEAINHAIYISKEDNVIYYYYNDFDTGTWYKIPHYSGVGAMTLGDIIFGDSILDIVKYTVNDMNNVKYHGKGKYTYKYTTKLFEVKISYEFTFYTKNQRIIEVRHSGSTYKITYGGQSVTLPADFTMPTKLDTPENLNITDGILSWDEVDGTNEYFVTIHSGTQLVGSQTVQTNLMNLYERIASNSNLADGTYVVTVRAIFFISCVYDSDASEPIDYVFVRATGN